MDARIEVELTAKIANFIRGMREAGNESNKQAGVIQKSTDKISKAVTSNLAGVFSVGAITAFGAQVIKVTAEFQKFQAVLGNTLGSAALANLKLKEIQDFAAKTPFGIQELTAAFVKLANSGFKPTGDQMRSLGDLASSTGKSFDQLAEAILDAQTGEFERLKEFGVRAKDAGDSVIFTYKGVQTQVEKTSVAIRDYITNLGNAEGVSGSMAKISQTLGGQISNLGDNWDKMLLSVGNNTSGVFNSSISAISKAIDKITQYNEELDIASRYKLEGDFFQQLNRAVNPFSDKGATKKELAVFGIKQANADVSKFVSNALAAAKSTADFGKALAGLKKQGDTALVYPGIGSEKERKGISDAYQLGVKAIQDARENFGSASTASANFGKTSTKAVKNLSTILADLDKELLKAGNQFGSTFEEQGVQRIGAYQKAIDSLIDLGYKPASKAIEDLKKAQAGFTFLDPGKERGPNQKAADPKLIGNRAEFFNKNGQKPQLNRILTEETQRALDTLNYFNQQASDIINVGLVNSLSGIGNAIGEALANGTGVVESVGISLLSSLGGVLTQLGEMAIGVGIGIEAIKTALKTLNPFVAIAAGVALVALGSFVSGKASNIASANKSSGQNNRPTAFAKGGVVSGPVNALVGEYSGANNNPEVIAPLDKLNSLIGKNIRSALAGGVSNMAGYANRGSGRSIVNGVALSGGNRVIQVEVSGKFEQDGGKLVAFIRKEQQRVNRI